MPERNEILKNLGAELPKDPLALASTPDELAQSSLRDRMELVGMLRSTNYETFPLYGESFLLAIVQDLYEQDEVFPYVPDDELRSRILLTVNWNRSTIEGRDRKPLVVVAFQGAQGTELVLRNALKLSGVDETPSETKGLQETATFRVTVIHHNRNLALFLGQQVRARLARNMELMRAVFGLHKVYPPSIQGPGQLEEYDDLFATFIDFRCDVLPRWQQTDDPEFIRKIVIRTTANASSIMQGAIVEGTKS